MTLYRALRLLITWVGLLALSTHWAQAQSPALFSASLPQMGLARDAAKPENHVVRTRDVTINFGQLAMPDAGAQPGSQGPAAIGQRLTLNLFDDMALTAIATEVTRTERGLTWIGRLDGVDLGQIVLVVSDGVVVANITMPERLYQVRQIRDGVYQIQQVDARLLPPDHGTGGAAPRARPASSSGPSAQNTPTALADDGSVIDVMVLYSPAARIAEGGTSQMLASIALAIAETNQSYLNSGITPRVRLVRAEELNYTETSSSAATSMSNALDCITNGTGNCSGVPALRNSFAADLVSLWLHIPNPDSCGLGWIGPSQQFGYSTVMRTCAYGAGNYSFGHEMGHNMGANHDVFVAPETDSTTPYSHGFVNTTAASPWRTVMAYSNACTAAGKFCTRIQYWSNPGLTFSGAVLGNASTADNHRVLNDNAFKVANFRTATVSCAYSLQSSSASAAAGGSSGSISLTSTSGCAWTATSNASWITITSGASGSGSGSAGYSVAANTGSATRTGTVTIGGQTFTVTQAGTTSCSYSLSPSSLSTSSSARFSNVAVTTGAGCDWVAVSTVSWLTITSGSGSGTGSGTVVFNVDTNTGSASRSGSLVISGQTFSVTQAGKSATCSYSLSNGGSALPSTISIGSSANTAFADITTSDGCAWSASSNVSWITFPAGASGAGSGSLQVAASANTSSQSRSGTVSIGGQSFTIVQAGFVSGCYTLLSSGGSIVTSYVLDFSAAAATASVNVTAPSFCFWSASSQVSWISITSGATGTGNGTVGVSMQANTTSAARVGRVVIGGYTFQVTQQPSSSNCSFTIDRSSEVVSGDGKAIVVSVFTTAGCNWTSSSSKSWITLEPGISSGNSSNIAKFTVAANTTTSTRRGTVTIAGRSFDVVQRPKNSFASNALNESFTAASSSISTVVFSGAFAQYTITVDSAGVRQVADSVTGRDGTDRLTGINRLQFFDQSIAFDTSSAVSAGAIYRLYAATFNRTPDLAGLGYWILQADGGQSPADMAAGFINSAEFQTLYGVQITDSYGTGLNVTNLVSGFYQNILHRTPDPAGLAYYAGQITSRAQTLGQILAQLSDSPENRSQVATQIQNGISYVPWEP